MPSRSSLTRRGPTSNSRSAGRRGAAASLVLALLATVAAIGGTVWYLGTRMNRVVDEPMVTKVSRGPYELVVVEQGEVESSNNVEIRCEVKSRGTNGTSILEVVAEGTHVKEGDLLLRLDASALDRERDTQQIAVNTSFGLREQAKNTLDAAIVAREEYLQGSFRQEEQLVLSEIFVAEENLKRAQLSVESGERLAARGLVTTLQLDGDRFAVEKARNELESAKTRLHVLRELTKKKMLIQFDSDIKTAEVKYENEKKNYDVECKKLLDIEEQIARCTVRAPQAGQVVYANIVSSRGGTAEFVVEPGALVREQQVIIRLPDPTRMQVRAKINEARITLIKAGMPVDIRIDAFGDETLEGEVTKVNQYAEPTSWFGAQVKEYATFISILEPPFGIRPGLTAEVRIHVENRPEALQIPVQALYEHKGRTFCLIKNGADWETREVQFESSNDKTVALKSGILDEGETVVLNPRRYKSYLQLPDLPDPPPTERLAKTKRASSAGDAPSGAVSSSDESSGMRSAKKHQETATKVAEAKGTDADASTSKDESRESAATGTSE